MKNISIFWTGGYDSTFRVVQLSRCEITIQPIYLSDNRKSEKNELMAIEEITSMLKKHPQTKANFLPLKIVDINQRVNDQEYQEAYSRIRENDFIGSQYVWLGAFAQNNKGVEMSIHKDDKAMNVILKYGKLKLVQDEIIGDYYIVDKDCCPNDIVKLWGNLHFPLAYITKIEMKNYYKKEGYQQIADKTWFCYSPINNKPCGQCNPCKYTIEEGLKERFTTRALMRYYYRKYISNLGIIRFTRTLLKRK